MKKQKSPPILLAPQDEDTATGAAALREKIWQQDKEHTWDSQPLNPWSRERESLFVRLTERDEGTSCLDSIPHIMARLQELQKKEAHTLSIENLLDPHLFIEQATLVLYLASHQPEDWDGLRGRAAAFLRAANAWAETHISLGDEWRAIHLAVMLRTAHRSLVAIRRPSGHSGGGEGN